MRDTRSVATGAYTREDPLLLTRPRERDGARWGGRRGAHATIVDYTADYRRG